MSTDARAETPVQERTPAPQRIRTTWHAAEARRIARLHQIDGHAQTLRRIRAAATAHGWSEALQAAANHHMERLEHHLELVEAGL